MAYEERDMSGSLFKREKKGDNWPDYGGPLMVNGEKLEIAAWLKEGKKGKFLSLKVSPRRERDDQPSQPSRDSAPLDDEIPF